MPETPQLIPLTGMSNMQDAWDNWLAIAADRGYDTKVANAMAQAIINPNRGSLRDYIEATIRACERIYEHTGQWPILLGHSIGGLVAQAVAAKLPLPRIVLICSAAPFGICNLSWPVFQRMVPYIGSMLRRQPFQPSGEDALDLIFNNCPDQLRHRSVNSSSGSLTTDTILGKIRVRSLRCPCLVVAGDRDRMMPLRIQESLSRKYSAEIFIGPYGHMPMLEDTDGTMIKLILNWLEQ